VSTVAQTARAGRARTRSSGKPWLLTGGVVWIVLFAALLTGVVAVNVTVLRLNLELDQVGRERTEIRADISRLRSELSSASATARIERLAQKEFGLVPADPDETIYIRLRR
jgi:cell division protein FtsL